MTLPGWSSAELVAARVRRWGGSLPQYRVGHRDLVERLRTELAGVPGLAVCGAALDGLGIAACVASAERAATEVMEDWPGE
jgi:oxygen-dependent protoporphyrinogen oxidase